MAQTLTSPLPFAPAPSAADLADTALPAGAAGLTPEVDESGWHFMTGMTVDDAAHLLDWLQNHGVRRREIRFQEDGFVTVRWDG